MQKIYFQNKPLFITPNQNEVADYLHLPTTIFIDELNEHAVRTMADQLYNETYDRGVFLYHNEQDVISMFRKVLHPIIAAGGLVVTPEKKLLLIFRNNKWDLPKGKLDEGEDLKTCAEREIKEETGLKAVEVGQKISVAYHAYYEKGQHILKETHWYMMSAVEQQLEPQTDEGIAECRWATIDEAEQLTDNSYGIIKEVISIGKKQIAD